MGIEYKAQLIKTLIHQKLRTSRSCVIKTVEPRVNAVVDDLENVASKINALEKEKDIRPWDEDQIPEEIVNTRPNPGHIVQQIEYSNIGVTELFLSNGMRVCYKCTDFLADQVLFVGFSYGGLSEIPEHGYFSCLMRETIAGEIGAYGDRPSVLVDMVAGKRAEVSTKIGTDMRNFSAYCSPSDLETALQLVYQLFTTNVKPGDEDVKIVMQKEEDTIRALERDPSTAFENQGQEINYGKSYFCRPMRISDLLKVDPLKACEYFNNCFKDPSTFTVVFVGNITPTITLPLIFAVFGWNT